VYVDGQPDGSGSMPVRTQDYAAIDRIGAGYGGGDRFVGQLDEVTAYRSALSASRIQAHFTTGSSAVSSGYATEVHRSVPTGYWRFADTAGQSVRDEVSADRPSIPSGVTPGRPGALLSEANAAFGFGGSTPIALTRRYFGATSVSVEAWINTTSTSSTTSYTGDPANTVLGDSTNDVWMGFGIHGGKVRLTRYNAAGSAWSILDGSTSVNDGQWHHIVGVSDQAANTARVFVDGTEDGRGPMPVQASDRTGIDRIGAGYGSGERFVGDLDEVAVYAGALSPLAVRDHYTASGRTIPISAAQSRPGRASTAPNKTRQDPSTRPRARSARGWSTSPCPARGPRFRWHGPTTPMTPSWARWGEAGRTPTTPG
jgi:hypothetical protein